jgi:hypothetical protein
MMGRFESGSILYRQPIYRMGFAPTERKIFFIFLATAIGPLTGTGMHFRLVCFFSRSVIDPCRFVY